MILLMFSYSLIMMELKYLYYCLRMKRNLLKVLGYMYNYQFTFIINYIYQY